MYTYICIILYVYLYLYIKFVLPFSKFLRHAGDQLHPPGVLAQARQRGVQAARRRYNHNNTNNSNTNHILLL